MQTNIYQIKVHILFAVHSSKCFLLIAGSQQLRFSLAYSYRNASIGLSLEALIAG